MWQIDGVGALNGTSGDAVERGRFPVGGRAFATGRLGFG
jgi:hypothetical protein